jgi:Tol biopolymer transport system component
VLSAAQGLLAFGGGTTAESLVWFDQSGKPLGTLPTTAMLNNVAFSPAGDQLVGTSTDPTRGGVWLIDIDRDAPTRLVPDGSGPVWSPDGKKLAYVASRRPGTRGVYTRSLSGQTDDTLLYSSSERVFLQDWSPDGNHLVYSIDTSRTKNDLWVLPLDGDRTPQTYLDSPAREIQAQVSPDGRWLAYVSDESGTPEVYVQTFPMAGNKRTLSTGGGAQPQWRDDGRQLYYLALDNTVMAVDVNTTSGTLQVGRSRPLFRPPLLGALTDYRNLYAVTRDGNRLLMKSIAAGAYQEPITVLVHWTRMLGN